MKKQTATEWLFAHLLPFLEFSDLKEREHFRKCLAEAKQMEKGQMIKFCQTWEDGSIEDTKTDLYNAIYGGDK
jgi:hypothetical protein